MMEEVGSRGGVDDVRWGGNTTGNEKMWKVMMESDGEWQCRDAGRRRDEDKSEVRVRDRWELRNMREEVKGKRQERV